MFKSRSEDRVVVLYAYGQTAGTVSAVEAREMVRSGVATPVRQTRKQISHIQYIDGFKRPVAGTKYSFDTEQHDNPQGVWAFARIGADEYSFRCFHAAQIDCGARVIVLE